MSAMTYTPLRRTMPGARWWTKAIVGGVVVVLLVLPVMVSQGWLHSISGIPTHPGLVHGGPVPSFRDTLLDPGRASFGVVILVGLIVYAAMVGGRRCWMITVVAGCWVVLAAFLRVGWWTPLGLNRHEIGRASFATLTAVDTSLVAVGAALLGTLTRSWRLPAVVVGSFVIVMGLGYLSRFGRGGAWVVSPLQIPVGFGASLFQDTATLANAVWQPLLAIALVATGVWRRRAALERNPGRLCPHCEYPLSTGPPRACAECGWSVDEPIEPA